MAGLFKGGIAAGLEKVGNTLFGGVGNVLSVALNSKAATVGAAQLGSIAGGQNASPQAVQAALTDGAPSGGGGSAGKAARGLNMQTTGEGYDTPLGGNAFTRFFTNWYKTGDDLKYELDAEGWPQVNTPKIIVTGGVVLFGATVVYFYRKMKKKKRSGGTVKRTKKRF